MRGRCRTEWDCTSPAASAVASTSRPTPAQGLVAISPCRAVMLVYQAGLVARAESPPS